MALPSPWTQDRVRKLTKLWNDTDLTADEIGLKIKMSGDAVIGKAHRLQLRPRAPRNGRSRWTADVVKRLTYLWEETSQGATEIGLDLGFTACAVIGKAHRLQLKPRVGPIKGRWAKKTLTPPQKPDMAVPDYRRQIIR